MSNNRCNFFSSSYLLESEKFELYFTLKRHPLEIQRCDPINFKTSCIFTSLRKVCLKCIELCFLQPLILFFLAKDRNKIQYFISVADVCSVGSNFSYQQINNIHPFFPSNLQQNLFLTWVIEVHYIKIKRAA